MSPPSSVYLVPSEPEATWWTFWWPKA